MGNLIGIGVGPGDPELMTIKAIRYIKEADVICLPNASKDKCRAYRIAEEAVPEIKEKECIWCDFRMIRDADLLKELHQEIYQKVRDHLVEDKKVAFLTIGDPATYSTFTYIMEIAKKDGFETELVSGVTSYDAAAARLGIALCEGEEELHIGTAQSDLEELIKLPGTKIIMKSGRSLRNVKAVLQKAEQDQQAYVYAVSDCGLPDEKLFYSADEIPEDGEYMTTIIVKQR